MSEFSLYMPTTLNFFIRWHFRWPDVGLYSTNLKNSIVYRNKHLEDLKRKIMALQAQIDELNKAHASALFNLFKILEEKNNLEATLSN